MPFMAIERFRDRDAQAVWRKPRDGGRGLPDGLCHVGSWIEANFDRCFQVMDCDDPLLLQEWVLAWGGLVTFEIVPVAAASHTRALVERHLEPLACRGGDGADFDSQSTTERR